MIPNDMTFPTQVPGWGEPRRITDAKMISSNHKTTAAEKLREIALSKTRNLVNEVYDRLLPLAEIAALEGKMFITATLSEEESEFVVQIAKKFRDEGFNFHSSEMGNTGRHVVRIEF